MTPTQLAEAATLGALLLDVGARHRLNWLRPSDFTDPWHHQVYTVLAQDTTTGRDSAITDIGAALLARLAPRPPQLPRIQDLLAATPIHPAVDEYARMVLETSIRASVSQQGVLLRAGALQAALTGTSAPLTTTAEFIHTTLDGLTARWATAHASDRPPTTARGDEQPREQSGIGMLLNADRFLTAHPHLDHDLVREHERDLVAALITRPNTVPDIAAWLPPEALLDRRWAATYAALIELTELDHRIDEVTITWHTQKASPRRGPGPDLDQLQEAVTDTLTSDPARQARIVAGDQIRHAADTAATALHHAAANPGIAVVDLLDTARLLTDTVPARSTGLPTTTTPTRLRALTTTPVAERMLPAAVGVAR